MDTQIKRIVYSHFELAMFETKRGRFYIETKLFGKTLQSEELRDFNIAAALFQIKLQELEGQ